MDISRPDIAKKVKGRRRLFIVIATILTIAAVVFVFNLDFATDTVSRDQIWIAEVTQGEMVRTVEGIGTLVAQSSQWLTARSGGAVETVHVLPGNWVAAGTVIVTLSNPELEQESQNARLQLEATEAELTSARARLQGEILSLKSELKQLEEAAMMARIDAEIATELNAEGLASSLETRKALIRTEQLDARLALEVERLAFREGSIEPELAVFTARTNQARAHFALFEAQVADLKITANFPGILQKLTLESGMRIAAGGQIAQVADPTKLKAVLRISETQARALTPGQEAEVNTRTSGRVRGTVARIDPNVETGTVAVDIHFSDALPTGVRADQTIDGIITLDRLDNVLMVDRPPMVLENDRARMFRLSADGNTAQRVMTEFGKASVTSIQILSGLKAGDKIIISDTSRWNDSETLILE